MTAIYGTILLRICHQALRPCGAQLVFVVDIVVVDVIARTGVKRVVIVVIVRRAKPEPFNQIPIC